MSVNAIIYRQDIYAVDFCLILHNTAIYRDKKAQVKYLK